MNNQQKTYLIAMVGIVIISGLVWGKGNLQQEKQINDPIKLGVILPLSGSSGIDQGEWNKRGLELALEDVDQDNNSIELVYDDSRGEPKTALIAYSSLRDRYNTPVVFTWGSSIGLALSPIVNKDHVVQMGIATAVPSYTSNGDFNFRVFPSSNLESEYLADTLINKLHVGQIATIKLNNDYGIGAENSFKEHYEKQGGQIITQETLEPGATDFRAQLTKIKNANPEFVYVASYPKEGGLLIKQARELGIRSQFIASLAILGGKEFFDITGSSAEGLTVVTSTPVFSENANPEAKKFADAYKLKYNEEPGPQHQYSARAYDALKIIYSLIQQCSTDTECIKSELFKVKDYKGAGGTISLDENGDIVSNFYLQVVRNGKFVSYE
ncbi:MAG TPA: ABC transporter substrate-binding protein [Candidatus Andersenbacteria bacterium]|nr:ABC transporter substrate-binding protein [Candidatus Andersenbacteria bacterium]